MADAYDKKAMFYRNCRVFIDYINYDWEFDQKWSDFQEANMKDINAPKQVEEIKREYFKMNVNSRLDTAFMLETDQERTDFLDFCRYVGSILSLSQIFKT